MLMSKVIRALEQLEVLVQKNDSEQVLIDDLRYLSILISIYLIIYLSIYLSNYPSVDLTIYLSNYLYISLEQLEVLVQKNDSEQVLIDDLRYLSIYISIYLIIYLYISGTAGGPCAEK